MLLAWRLGFGLDMRYCLDRWWLEGHLFLFHVLELQTHVRDRDYLFGHMAAHADLTPHTHRVVELTRMVIED